MGGEKKKKKKANCIHCQTMQDKSLIYMDREVCHAAIHEHLNNNDIYHIFLFLFSITSFKPTHKVLASISVFYGIYHGLQYLLCWFYSPLQYFPQTPSFMAFHSFLSRLSLITCNLFNDTVILYAPRASKNFSKIFSFMKFLSPTSPTENCSLAFNLSLKFIFSTEHSPSTAIR